MSLQATLAWWVERVLSMAAVATRISTLGHSLPLLPALAEHHCVGSSVPWRAGKTGDSAVERLFSGKTWVGLAGVDQPHPLVVRSRVSPPTPGPKTLACGHAAP